MTGPVVNGPVVNEHGAVAPGPGGFIYYCRLRHVRPAPQAHSFSYRTWMWLVDLDALPRFRWPLRALARFEPGDHLGRPALPIRDNVAAFLAARGIDLAGGKIFMLAHARSLGYGFNSLTVYWCYRPSRRSPSRTRAASRASLSVSWPRATSAASKAPDTGDMNFSATSGLETFANIRTGRTIRPA